MASKIERERPRSDSRSPASDASSAHFPASDFGHGTLDESVFLAYSVGMRVRHPEFGAGKIMEKSGAGDSLKIVVLFDKIGRAHV